MHVHSSACKQGTVHTGSCINRECTSKTDMEEKKLLNTVIFLFSLRTKGGWTILLTLQTSVFMIKNLNNMTTNTCLQNKAV